MYKIFEKIKNYFNNVFNRKNIKLIEDNTRVIQNESDSNEIYEEKLETNKQDFFTVYKNLKAGKIKITDLMINDILKIQLMMQKEADIMDEKIEGLENDLVKLDTEKSKLEKDKQIYVKKSQEANRIK